MAVQEAQDILMVLQIKVVHLPVLRVILPVQGMLKVVQVRLLDMSIKRNTVMRVMGVMGVCGVLVVVEEEKD